MDSSLPSYSCLLSFVSGIFPSFFSYEFLPLAFPFFLFVPSWLWSLLCTYFSRNICCFIFLFLLFSSIGFFLLHVIFIASTFLPLAFGGSYFLSISSFILLLYFHIQFPPVKSFPFSILRQDFFLPARLSFSLLLHAFYLPAQTLSSAKCSYNLHLPFLLRFTQIFQDEQPRKDCHSFVCISLAFSPFNFTFIFLDWLLYSYLSSCPALFCSFPFIVLVFCFPQSPR